MLQRSRMRACAPRSVIVLLLLVAVLAAAFWQSQVPRGVGAAHGPSSTLPSPIEVLDDEHRYFLKVDLRDSRVRFRVGLANGDAGGYELLSGMAGRYADQGYAEWAVINADYFAGDCPPNVNCAQGLTYIDGQRRDNWERYGTTWQQRANLGLDVWNNTQIAIGDAQSERHSVVAGGPWVVTNGGPPTCEARYVDGWTHFSTGEVFVGDQRFYCTTRRPLTMVGYSADRQHLFMGVSTGGMNVLELAQWLKDRGASDVLKLDGGGSSGIIHDGVLKKGTTDRPLVNALAVLVDPAPRALPLTTPAASIVDAMAATQAYTDRPVADLQVSRTWVWGPAPIGAPLLEPYLGAAASGDETANGYRWVQYYDKGRMEVTESGGNPRGDPGVWWHVTGGLLVRELVSGQLQVADDGFELRSPAAVNVVGDADDPIGPTYATFAGLLSAPAAADGATITQRVYRDGRVATDPSLASRGVTAAHHVQVPGLDHQVASPFWEFMTAAGLVEVDGATAIAPLFRNPFYATGLPITEAYWAAVKVGGRYMDVLVQCFERRCLTYTPGNPEGWQVEAGNVGQHYYSWRYHRSDEVTTHTVQAVTVHAANASATNTGVSVQAGEQLAIRAAGAWCMGGPECAGPDGIRDADPDREQPLLLPSAKIGTLIGTITSDGSVYPPDQDWFVIGSGGPITASRSGALYVTFNEREVDWPLAVTDNSGSMTVTIERPS